MKSGQYNLMKLETLKTKSTPRNKKFYFIKYYYKLTKTGKYTQTGNALTKFHRNILSLNVNTARSYQGLLF